MFSHPFIVATTGTNFLRKKGEEKTVRLNLTLKLQIPGLPVSCSPVLSG